MTGVTRPDATERLREAGSLYAFGRKELDLRKRRLIAALREAAEVRTRAVVRCACGRVIVPPPLGSGIDLDWIHAGGEVFCEESGWLDDDGEWHDPPMAQAAR